MSVYVKPAPGLIVRDPDTREPLPAAGAWVPRTTYWVRRLRDGDVAEAAPPPAEPEISDPKSKKGSR